MTQSFNCELFGLKLPSDHRCPPCAMAIDCQEAFEIKKGNGLFADLTHADIWDKIFLAIDRKAAPTYHKLTLLGIRESGARLSLFGASDTSLVLRLEYDGGRIEDSAKVMEFYRGWHTTVGYIEATKRWLEKIQSL